jgi:hypothetical protein
VGKFPVDPRECLEDSRVINFDDLKFT